MIETTLKTVDADAGMPKMPFVFSTPIATAASATSRMKGNIICVIVVASAAFSGEKPLAINPTNCRENITPTIQMTLSMTASRLKTMLASRHASASLLLI